MSFTKHEKARRIVFVSRNLSGESLRTARAIRTLNHVRLLGICELLPDDDGKSVFADLVRVDNVHDSDQLVVAASRFEANHGSLDRIVTTTETLLKPVALASATLGLPGMSVATVRRALDKTCLKQSLQRASIGTARDCVLTSRADAGRFVCEVGFPIVLKPVGGSGGLATWCIRNHGELEMAFELMQPGLRKAFLAEEYLEGEELCIDTITIKNEPRFYSICCYRPSILEALEDPRIQWRCLMPRDIGGDLYRDFIEQGLAAVRALAVGNAMTHMEGFVLKKGGVRFTDATLRPAGARISPMLAFAYDMDPHLAWARAAIDGCVDGPWERKHAVGTIFLRGPGRGLVAQVDGMELLKKEIGDLMVDGRMPLVGANRSVTYTGDGYVTVRHPETATVEQALDFISQTVHITYSAADPAASPNGSIKDQWRQRLDYVDKQLNKPAWDNDSIQAIGKG